MMENEGSQNVQFAPGLSSQSISPKKSSGVSKVLVIIVGVIVLALIGVSGYLLRGQFTGVSASPSPSPVLETFTEPSPSPTPSFDRSQYSVRVLNGTKTSGLAGTVSAKLTELGYQADKTGNATSSAIAKTTVRVKSGLDDLMAQLIQDLSPDYNGASGSALKDSDSADAEVIIGAE